MKNIVWLILLFPLYVNASINDIGGNILSSIDTLGGAMTIKNAKAPDAFSNNVSNTKKQPITLKTPKYLSVPSFDKCLGKERVESATFWCLPSFQKEVCPNESWRKLQNMDLEKCGKR